MIKSSIAMIKLLYITIPLLYFSILLLYILLSLAARQQVIAEGVYYLVLIVFAYPSKQYSIFQQF